MTNDRIEKAVGLFKSGYNCSQSVVAAFADMYGFTEEQALRMSASFGGGIGRMRQTCGAACGMFLLAGLEKGAVETGMFFHSRSAYGTILCQASLCENGGRGGDNMGRVFGKTAEISRN